MKTNNRKYSNDFVAAVIADLIRSDFRYAKVGRAYGIDRRLIDSWYRRFEEKEKRNLYDWNQIRSDVASRLSTTDVSK